MHALMFVSDSKVIKEKEREKKTALLIVAKRVFLNIMYLIPNEKKHNKRKTKNIFLTHTQIHTQCRDRYLSINALSHILLF